MYLQGKEKQKEKGSAVNLSISPGVENLDKDLYFGVDSIPH